MNDKIPDELWVKYINDYRSSDLSLVRWCEVNNVSFGAMRYHLYRKKSCSKDNNDNQFAFLPIKLAPASNSLKLNFNNISIDVDDSTDLVLLKKALRELQ